MKMLNILKNQFMKNATTKIFICLIIVFATGYITACSYKSRINSCLFDSIQIGDTIDAAFKKFGQPTFREKQNELFSRYATIPCENPCVERFWFENRFPLIVDEAWSLEVDKEGKIIHKSYWTST